MKNLIIMLCLMLVLGTTVIPKPCEEHQKYDYCWLEQKGTKGLENGKK